ncbi:hypothetical protein C5C27_04450 [Rathayibacter sp. AY2B7]|nr:hypothetical protein C5C27_04450 [Rathayibacter sp. AY2B7]
MPHRSSAGLRLGRGRAGAAAIGVPHQLELDPAAPYALWPTLAGRTVADLATVSSEHRGSGPATTETEARR